jgi:hypothetical protein
MRLPDHPLVKEQTSKSDSTLFSDVSEPSLPLTDSSFLRPAELASLQAKTGEFIKLS